jgi:hypothetical protein
MIPVKTAIGNKRTKGARPNIMNNMVIPAVVHDKRPLAPCKTLMTVSPTRADPPIPPKRPVKKFAMPCTAHSWMASKEEGGSLRREFTTV